MTTVCLLLLLGLWVVAKFPILQTVLPWTSLLNSLFFFPFRLFPKGWFPQGELPGQRTRTHCRLPFPRTDSSYSTATSVHRDGTMQWGQGLLFLGTRVSPQLAVWPWASQFLSLDLGVLVCKMKELGRMICVGGHTRPLDRGLVWLADTGVSDSLGLRSFPQQWRQWGDNFLFVF